VRNLIFKTIHALSNANASGAVTFKPYNLKSPLWKINLIVVLKCSWYHLLEFIIKYSVCHLEKSMWPWLDLGQAQQHWVNVTSLVLGLISAGNIWNVIGATCLRGTTPYKGRNGLENWVWMMVGDIRSSISKAVVRTIQPFLRKTVQKFYVHLYAIMLICLIPLPSGGVAYHKRVWFTKLIPAPVKSFS